MRTYTGRPHDVRQVGSYENVPRLCLFVVLRRAAPPQGAPPRARRAAFAALRAEGKGGSRCNPMTPIYWYVALRLAAWWRSFVRLGVGVGSLPRTATSCSGVVLVRVYSRQAF